MPSVAVKKEGIQDFVVFSGSKVGAMLYRVVFSGRVSVKAVAGNVKLTPYFEFFLMKITHTICGEWCILFRD